MRHISSHLRHFSDETFASLQVRNYHGRGQLLQGKLGRLQIGSRNAALNAAWFRLAGFRDVLDRAFVEAELLVAALACGLSEQEARKVMR